MAQGLARFRGRTLLIVSGRDITAQEFLDHVQVAPTWKDLLIAPRVTRVNLPEADHTFSRAASRQAVEDHTVAWLRGFDADAPAPCVAAAAGAP